MPLTESIFTKVLDYIWAANLNFDTELQVVNCRTTILQQGDSNTDFLRGISKTFKGKLFYITRLMVRSFLLKLKSTTMCFELHIFYSNLQKNAHQNRNPAQTFLWGYSHLKKLEEVVWWSYILIKTCKYVT